MAGGVNTAPIDYVRSLPRDARIAFYRDVGPAALAAALYDPLAHARQAQRELLTCFTLATIEIIQGGRRAGKTWLAVMLFLREVLSGRLRDLSPRIIAATDGDIRQTLLFGRSGIMRWCPPEHRPKWTKSLGHGGTLEFPTVGTEVAVLSAQKPSQAIGEGSGFTLADDPAKWVDSCGEERAKEMLTQARISNSEGPSPCLLIPTTPRGEGIVRRFLTPGEMADTRITFIGDTNDNTALSPRYRASIKDLRDERPEEFDGILRHETPGALWRREWIRAGYVTAAPELRRVVVAVDPADDGKHDSDETGIVVVGLGEDGRLYVLADYTARWTADRWAAIAAWAFAYHRADAIAAECNRARSLVVRCLAVEAPNVRIVEVDATRGKATRAEPCALQTRDGLVCFVVDGPQLTRPGHVWIKVPIFDPATGRREIVDVEVKRDRRGWETLEDELCGWDPRKRRSPNGLDALVWGAWHLKPPEVGPQPWPEAPPALPGRYEHVDPRAPSITTDPRASMRQRLAARRLGG